ncbi:DUF2564 family protein [Bacillus timonensis]|nr:DUF2564 family protein [Bacillus timonensis]
MNQHDNQVNTGFNELQQVKMSVKAAQKMVGSATMNMDNELLQDATRAVQNARTQLNSVKENGTGVDEAFLCEEEKLLDQCEEQLNEAKH